MRTLVRSLSNAVAPLSTTITERIPNVYNSPDFKFTKSSKRVGLVARKLGMMSLWDEWGVFTSVTILQGVSNQVLRSVQVDEDKCYVEVGVDELKKDHREKKSYLGLFRRYGIPAKRKIYSFPVTKDAMLPTGLKLFLHHFVPGQYVDVQSTSTGKGFQGGMKRWGFKGLPRTHGVSLAHRSIGSTGNRHDPGKVFKGKKMPGRMGNKTVSIHSLKVCLLTKILGYKSRYRS
jgi:large subunit ribosomal protein L3